MTAAEARKLLQQVDRNYRAWRTRKDCRFVFGPTRTDYALMLRYHLARTERDAAAARRLARRHPQWPEAVALARKLT